MPTITIPASELQPGDKISFGGNPLTVQFVSEYHYGVYVYVNGLYAAHSRSLLTVPKAIRLTVERPEPVDPDAELIEAMAKAIYATYRAVEPTVANWDDPDGVEGRDQYRHEARAALAVVRDYDELLEVIAEA